MERLRSISHDLHMYIVHIIVYFPSSNCMFPSASDMHVSTNNEISLGGGGGGGGGLSLMGCGAQASCEAGVVPRPLIEGAWCPGLSLRGRGAQASH